MQIPSNIPKPTVPAQDTKVEPVARIAPVVMGDAAMRIDPSVLLKVPVPVSQGPRTTHTVRQSLDHSGPIYVSPEEAEDSEAAAYIAALSGKMVKAEARPHRLPWPLPKEFVQQQQREKQQTGQDTALAKTPADALQMLKLGLERSPMLAIARFAEALGIKREKLVGGKAEGGSGSAATITAAQALQSVPEPSSLEVLNGVTLVMHGQLFWQGELTPGVYARISRDDAYAQDPALAGGALVKGAQVIVEIELPTLGAVKMRAMQVGQSVSVVIEPQLENQAVLARNLPALRSALNASGGESVNLRVQAVDGQVIA